MQSRISAPSVAISAEMDPVKAERTRGNLEATGLGDVADLRGGDARETARTWTTLAIRPADSCPSA